ncbi:hypothetical protein OG417_48460 [Actinoallomurus sp. NBC_01490]|uniref:hypothetical protein n=1 Tax=Actinoallomurus sp. NBC_01490 TaxID=2903557 RepID=UPI002E320A52|nr:hypothetical protein [Actinoallomurus sp. NBC_01490]
MRGGDRGRLLWGHCHHKATGGLEPEHDLLTRMGVDVQEVKGGCCGLAGSWGFEEGKYDISLACGEQALLPAVRDADPGTLIVANGFSCRSQIADAGTGRRAPHLAEVLSLARQEAPAGPRPEHDAKSARPAPPLRRRAARVAAVVAVTLAAGGLLALRKTGDR